jgi:hypothetical protein
VAYGVAAAVMVVSANKLGAVGKDVAGTLALGVWVGGIVHAAWINREWLRWRSEHPPWYAAGQA